MEITSTLQGLEKSAEDQLAKQSSQQAEKMVKKEVVQLNKKTWENKIGMTFGRLTVTKIIRQNKDGRALVRARCVCTCGGLVDVGTSRLLSGNTKSCGCLRRETTSKRAQTHAMSKLPEYKAWKTMKARCNNPKHHAFHRYGGRGIQVCKPWMESFENFVNDMGLRPAGMTIDRKDNNKGYCKENCHWASIKTQARNRSNNHVLTMNGQSHCINEWAEILGIHHNKIRERLSRGCSIERSLSTKKLHKHLK